MKPNHWFNGEKWGKVGHKTLYFVHFGKCIHMCLLCYPESTHVLFFLR